jgi:hypothetical protein
MKNTKGLSVKILAGVVAAALIGGILFVTNAFVGNPIAASFADKAIKQYAEKNYSSLELEIGKASYNFKDNSYIAMAKSPKSIDTKFAVYYRNGEVLRDDYNSYVLSMFNTLQRFSDEYSSAAKALVSKELGFENNTTMVMYNKDEYESAVDNLELDMKFDKTLPIDAEVTLRLDLIDSSIENIAKVLTDAHKVFSDNGCNFSKYGLYAENDGMLVMINNVTPADIESGELANLLEKAKKSENSNGISVFIKGEKK